MAGFYACLKTQEHQRTERLAVEALGGAGDGATDVGSDKSKVITPSDPTMAESLSEVSGSLEVLEASDEVKKKSKFKAFKNFFGKKKKKEPEGAHGGRRLKPSLSSDSINISSLQPVQEGQRTEARAKSSMGSKALSHDSIFMLDPEPEISVRRIRPSPEPQRGRPRQRSQVSRTLPRSGASNVHGAVSGLMFGAVPRYVPRSGIWIGGSKLPSLRRRHSSSSPPLIRSYTTSADFEEISVDEESPKTPQKKPTKIMTSKKSSFEPSLGLACSQSLSTYTMIAGPGSTHPPMSLSSPAGTCLDSSAARHKMALNPRKQKKIKNPETTGRAKQEEPPVLPVASGEERNITKPREADKKKPRKDSAGVSSLKQSKRNETYPKKPADQAAWASAAGSESWESMAQGRQNSKKGSSASGSSECVPRGRSFKQSSRGLGPGEGAGSPPADKSARDSCPWNLSLEQQVAEQPVIPHTQRAPPQEPLSDRDSKGKRKAGIDVKARKTPVSQSVPEAPAESEVWGPSPGQEEGASGADQPEARAALSTGTESLSTTQEDVIFSVAMEAQVFMDPSHLQSEREDAFSFDLQAIKFKMESVQDIPTVCREKSPANILRAFTASISGPAGALAEGGISAEKLTPRRLSWVLTKPRAQEAPSDPESLSEDGSGSEQQLLPRHSLRVSGKHDNDQEVFTELGSSAAELSSPEQQQLASRYSTGAFGNPGAEVSSDPESTSEEESGSEQQQAPGHPFQPLGEPNDDRKVSDAENSGNSSGSDEPLTPASAAQALGEPEDQVSTESNASVEKYDSAEDWSSSEEYRPPGPRSQASAKPAHQQRVASVSKILPKEWGVSVERLAQSFTRPILLQQMSSGSVSPPGPRGSSLVEPAPPRQPVQLRPSPQAQPQASAGPSSAAAPWVIPQERLPPRISSKCLGRPWVEQPVSKGPQTFTAFRITSADLPPPPLPPRPHSQPLVEPIAEQAIRAPLKVPPVEGSVCVELPPPRRPSQAVPRPVMEQQVCLGAESAGVDQKVSVLPPPLPRYHALPPMRPLVPRQASASPERWAAPAEPRPPQGPAQASVNLKVGPTVPSGLEAAAKVTSVEPLLPTYSAAALTNPKAPQASETAGREGRSAELQSRGPSQPAVRPKVPPQPGPQDTMPRPGLGLVLSPALVPGPASPRTVYRSWVSSSFEQQDSGREESAALEWGISLEPRPPLPPLPPRNPSQHPRRRAVERADSRRSVSAPPERSSPPEQQSAPAAAAATAAEPKLPRCAFRSRGSTKVKQPVSEALEGAEALRRIAMEQHSLQRSSQAPTTVLVKQPASAAPEGSVAQKSVSTDELPPRVPSQALTKAVVKQAAFLIPDSSHPQRSISTDELPPRMPSQAPTKAVVKQAASVALESPMAQRSVSTDELSPRVPSQALTKAVVKQAVFLVPDGSLTQRSISTDQLSPKMASHALSKAVLKQPASVAPEKFATERDASTEPWPPRQPSLSPGRYRVQQISSNFEIVAAQAAMSAKAASSKYPASFSSRSKVQEMSSRLEKTAAGSLVKKLPVSRHPSQSFVKFMAEQIFSENPANPLSANQLSRTLLRSKVQYPVFLGPENAGTEGDIPSKLLPLARPLQPSGRPEGPREVLPRSESAPVKPKQSSSKEQLPPRRRSPARAKLEDQHVSSSASQSCPEIRKCPEEQLPPRGPLQAKEGVELQPRFFSAGPASTPGDWSGSEECRPHHRRYLCQVLAEPEYLPQIHPGSMSTTTSGTTSESTTSESTTSESLPSSRSLPRGPASPNKTKKHRQVSEDLLKNILPLGPKPMRLTTALTRQASTSGGTSSKGEGLRSGNRNNNHPEESTSETSVETIFGVRLRKVPSLKKYKSEKQDDLPRLSLLSLGPVSSSTGKEQQIKRSFSQGLLGSAEDPGIASDLAEKQQTRLQSESIAKKQTIYKVPGKALGRQSDWTASEPAWITMVKQRQKSSQVHIPKKEPKTKNKAGARPEAKELRHGGELAAAHRIFQKGAGLAIESQPRKTFIYNLNKLEKMTEKKLPKFTKAGFGDQKIAQMPAMAKETRRSSTLPAMFRGLAEPEEPVWFSLAKEKAKAWSHIAEIMQ